MPDKIQMPIMDKMPRRPTPVRFDGPSPDDIRTLQIGEALFFPLPADATIKELRHAIKNRVSYVRYKRNRTTNRPALIPTPDYINWSFQYHVRDNGIYLQRVHDRYKIPKQQHFAAE